MLLMKMSLKKSNDWKVNISEKVNSEPFNKSIFLKLLFVSISVPNVIK